MITSDREKDLDYTLGCIRQYAYDHNLTGGQIRVIFDAGICAPPASDLTASICNAVEACAPQE